MKRLIIILVCLAFSLTVRAADSDADKMYKEYESHPAPAFDGSKREDQAYIQSYLAERQKYEDWRADFAKQFDEKYPDDPRAMKMMTDRWMILGSEGKSKDVLAETDAMLAKNTDEARAADIRYARASALMNGSDVAATTTEVDAFIKAAPKDPRGAQLLSGLAMRSSDPAEQKQFNQRIIDNYPDSRPAKWAKGQIRRVDEMGKPFELAFEDVTTGNKITMADLKGKVVVVDFWATWCGPCVGEMPNMKKLYNEYHDKGVEFIGVSLDQPGDGLNQLKTFLAKNEITWPQYYQGKGWDSEFSSSWGINSIPTMFVIDAEGKLYSTTARGQLETILPKLLKASSPS